MKFARDPRVKTFGVGASAVALLLLLSNLHIECSMDSKGGQLPLMAPRNIDTP